MDDVITYWLAFNNGYNNSIFDNFAHTLLKCKNVFICICYTAKSYINTQSLEFYCFLFISFSSMQLIIEEGFDQHYNNLSISSKIAAFILDTAA